MGRTSKDLNDLVRIPLTFIMLTYIYSYNDRHVDIWQCTSSELDNLDWSAPRSNGSFNSGTGSLVLDDDFYMDFSDTLFSSLTSNQPFAFPNPREIGSFVVEYFVRTLLF